MLQHTLGHASLSYLPAIAALCSLRYFFRAVRWSALVRQIRVVSIRRSLDRVLLSQAADRILPFQLGCLAIVQVTAVKFQIWRLQLVGTDMLERLMDGLMFALFLTLAVSTLSLGALFMGLTAVTLYGGAALLSCGCGARDPRQSARLRLPRLGRQHRRQCAVSPVLRRLPLPRAAGAARRCSAGLATAYALCLEAVLIAPILFAGPPAAFRLRLCLRDLIPARRSHPASPA